jgi:glucan phosphoethanolaminetransferase (alkaline phosphatase superfamily)
MAIWAGPTVWKYAAPVIGVTAAAVSRVMSSFAAMFKKTPPVATNGIASKKEPTQT